MDSGVTLDAIERPLAELGDGWIKRVNPETRKLVIRHRSQFS